MSYVTVESRLEAIEEQANRVKRTVADLCDSWQCEDVEAAACDIETAQSQCTVLSQLLDALEAHFLDLNAKADAMLAERKKGTT